MKLGGRRNVRIKVAFEVKVVVYLDVAGQNGCFSGMLISPHQISGSDLIIGPTVPLIYWCYC